MSPKASIIICTYNRQELLEASIKSLQAQLFSQDMYEIVVVDNNSNDGTRKVVEELAVESPVKIKYVFEGRQGLSFARNSGVDQAAGEIIVFTDDDIDAEKNWLRELVSMFDRADVAGAGGPIRPVWPLEKPDWLTEEFLGYLAINEFESVHKSGEFKGPLYPWGANIAFHRDVFKTIGMFSTDLGRIGSNLLSNEEVVLCRKIEASGKRIRFAAQAVIHHKISPERLTKHWFYHRTYWQGRSEAIVDTTTKSSLFKELRKHALTLLNNKLNKDDNFFNKKCWDKYALGYLGQTLLFQGQLNFHQEKEKLRILRTIVLEIVDTADDLISNKNDEIYRLLVELDGRDYQLAVRDQQLAERDRQLAMKESHINDLLESYSWKITYPLRKIMSIFKNK